MLQTFRSATVDDLPVILALLAEDAIRYVAEPAESTDRQGRRSLTRATGCPLRAMTNSSSTRRDR